LWAKTVKQNGKKIWEFPANGILILQEEFEGGIVNEEYYILRKNGTKRKITHRLSRNDTSAGLPTIDHGGGGTIDDITFSDYYLQVNEATNNDEPFSVRQKFDSTTKALVYECRRNRSLTK
jgi:hypothetical protein